VPQIAEPVSLRRFLGELDPVRRLYFADEGGGDPANSIFREGPAVILVGPEGGFTEDERVFIRGTGALPLSLGPRILRAETAALAALSVYMALAGDWR
jgi:16S rRNA (uracil1498-N3)-methyltransferase